MGHQVEYVVESPPFRAHAWLSALPGAWFDPELPGEAPCGEFAWDGQTLHVELGPAAYHICVPGIKYSWLIGDHAPSLDWVARFEAWLASVLPGVRAVRLDELLRLDWEREAGPLDEAPDPVRALWVWLPAHEYGDDHFRLMPN